MKILIYLLAMMVAIFLGYGCWTIGKNINYSLSYKEMVKTTI